MNRLLQAAVPGCHPRASCHPRADCHPGLEEPAPDHDPGGSMLAVGALLGFGAALSPGRATHFSLLRQRKVSKRKAILVAASLRCATGNLRCSLQAGSGTNSPSAQTSACPDPLEAPLLGASTRGWEEPGEEKERKKVSSDRSRYYFHSCLRSYSLDCRPEMLKEPADSRLSAARPALLSAAVGQSQAAQRQADQGSCLFEPQASLHETPPGASSAGYRAATLTPARLFFAYFLLAKQKKVSRPPRRQSGTGTQQWAGGKHGSPRIVVRGRLLKFGMTAGIVTPDPQKIET